MGDDPQTLKIKLKLGYTPNEGRRPLIINVGLFWQGLVFLQNSYFPFNLNFLIYDIAGNQ
jgi:hypothetical protein